MLFFQQEEKLRKEIGGVETFGQIIQKAQNYLKASYLNIIYCITRSDTIGGAHVHVADLSQWMNSNGHKTTVLVGGDGVYCDELEQRGIAVSKIPHLCRPLRPLWDLMAILELRKEFRRFSPDIICLHSTKAGIVGRIATIGLGVPVVFTAHGWSFTEGVDRRRARFYLFLEKCTAPFVSRIITVSEYDRRLAIQNRLTRPEKLIAIHNGMPDVDDRARLDRNKMPVQIISVARLDDQKDHITLLEALSRLGTGKWSLRLVGDGPLDSILKDKARELKILDSIEFLGLRHDIPTLLAESDIFALASKWEGFPLSILEAMRAGLPVVASDVGGTRESVINNVTGFLVPRGDIEALSEKLGYLIERPDERQRLGKEARNRFLDFFTFGRMARATAGVYVDVVGDTD